MGPVKLPFAESDLAPLVKRYASSTIVTMLREVAKCKSARLDWAMLCKGTATGITNPREYQALWRSIAYRADLDESFDGNDSPLEDDSDMEIDLDPLPSVSPAVAESICSYVKSDLQQHELEDARLEQNAVQAGMGHQADVSTARLQLCSAATPGESTVSLAGAKVPCSAAMNQSDSRKRRRLWTPEEDLALIAAVDKCGEGNWTAVLKSHYDFDRSASQLSQRWALIRKRREVQEKAGYGIGSGVSPLASGYKDLRSEGLKSATPTAAGSQPGAPREGAKLGTVPMPIKQQPVSSTSSVPVSKRIPVASAPTGTTEATSASASHASVLETQRARALPASGVSSSWAGAPGLRPQAHGPQLTSMRGAVGAAAAAGASGGAAGQQARMPEGAHMHASGVRRPQVFYTSSQSATSAIPIDSKYAASRNMGAGVAPRGGGSSKGVHGPDPMIQAAAMAAGARIAPASAAASLLKAAQSGNVVHIGSGGLARSKLGLTSQAGSGNAGGNPGIVHYIRTGSGGASLAATSSSLQRTSSHHLAKNQPNNRSFGSNNAGSHNSAGNSSPLSVPSVSPAAAHASRNNINNNNNNPQGLVQSSKPASFSKRGCSPQHKSSCAPPTPTSTLVTTPPVLPAPSSSTASAPAHTSVPGPAHSSVFPAPKSTATPGSTPSTPTPSATSRSIPSPAPPSTARTIPASTSMSTPPAGTLASGSASTPSATSSVPGPPASTFRPTLPAAASAPTPASSTCKTALPAPASAATPALLASKPIAASSTSLLPIPASIAKPTLASPTSVSTPASISGPSSASTTKPFPGATPASISGRSSASPTSVSTPASISGPSSASISRTSSASPTSVSTLASISGPSSASTTKPIPGATPASISRPSSASPTSVSTLASISGPSFASTTKPIPGATPASISRPSSASPTSVSTLASISGPSSASTTKPIPGATPASLSGRSSASPTSVSTPASISGPSSASTTKPILGATPASNTKHIPATAPAAPASISRSTPALSSASMPASSTAASTAAVPIPACGFSAAEQGVDSHADG